MAETNFEANSKMRILIVDDDESLRIFFHKKLSLQGYKVADVDSLDQAFELIAHRYFDVILLDNHLGDKQSIDSISSIIRMSPTSLIVMLTAHGSIDLAVQAMNAGASSFLVKSDPLDLVFKKLCHIIGTQPFHFRESVQFRTMGIVGDSASIKRIFDKISKIGPTDVTVLVTGESGTGKELVARAIHEISPRVSSGTFMAINCGAITESLLEAELFGSKKGSYTGSAKDRLGYFEACENGTLFLDEIGEMSPHVQVKFLRVLQEREITPVGSCDPVKVNARIIAATNCNLMRNIRSGRFREDLFYRLNVVTIDLPPLRERIQDLPELIFYCDYSGL